MFRITSVSMGLLAAVFSTLLMAERPWPGKVFDCHVVTRSGAHGLVSIQSFSMQSAEDGVIGLPAATQLGVDGVAAGVVQCVEKDSGRSFGDAGFQEWISELDQ